MPDSQELPLSLVLNGDESYFAEFNLRAEAVMERLGIKRSRLHQISGRELRVGRARVDRYQRALYRESDVEAYRNWTRASATHQKAAEVLHSAELRFDEQLEALGQRVDRGQLRSAGLTARLLGRLRTAAQASSLREARRLSQGLGQLRRQLAGLETQLLEQLRELASLPPALLGLLNGQAELRERLSFLARLDKERDEALLRHVEALQRRVEALQLEEQPLARVARRQLRPLRAGAPPLRDFGARPRGARRV